VRSRGMGSCDDVFGAPCSRVPVALMLRAPGKGRKLQPSALQRMGSAQLQEETLASTG
jgi:hypothetical protein